MRFNRIVRMDESNHKQKVKDSDYSVRLNAHATQSKNAIYKRNETTKARKGISYNAG
jgi:hypothetical protein